MGVRKQHDILLGLFGEAVENALRGGGGEEGFLEVYEGEFTSSSASSLILSTSDRKALRI